MSADQITALIRQILPVFGSLLAVFGFSSATSSAITNLLMEISGPLVIAGSAIWAAIAHRPAAVAASAQALMGVEVDTTHATPAIKAAVNAVKAGG